MSIHHFSQFVDGSRAARPNLTEAFTRQHYVAIAQILKSHKPSGESSDWRGIVEDLATLFVRDNPNFRRETFYAACGY